MGMYDSLKIKKDLPLPDEAKSLDINWKEIEYQTKCFDNCLVDYIIDEQGNLFEEVVEREYIPWPEEEKKDKKPWNLFKDAIIKSKKLEPINYHGIIRFYCYECFDDNNDFYIDYDAYYSYGKLDKIEIVEYKKYEKKRFSIEEFEKEQNKFSTKFIKVIKKYSGWTWFWRRVEKMLYKIIGVLEKIRVFLLVKII